MLDIIGIEDSHVRDDLVYMVMATWIFEGKFSHEELRKILQILLNDQHMFYQIGEKKHKLCIHTLFLCAAVTAYYRTSYRRFILK